MRKLIVSEFVSLDGVMQGPGGAEEDRSGGFEHGGWSLQFMNEEAMEFKSDELFSMGAILIGRRTYEIFAGAWPSLTDEDIVKMIKEGGGDAEANPFADRMNSLPKYVASTTLKQVEWNNSTLIKNVAEDVAKLKQEAGEDIVVSGSGGLVQTLMHHDLVDEYQLMVFPIVLGSGKRLFQDASDTKGLKLAASKTFRSGVVVLTYEPTAKEGESK